MRIDRLNLMEQYILKRDTVSLDELSEAFNVSINTIRRDLKELLGRGQIKKVYGGVSVNDSAVLLPMSIRAQNNRESKQKIGLFAAKLVTDKSCIFLDSGSTTVELLPHLSEKKDITIITHSLSVMYEAAKYPTLNVFALGGMYSPGTSSYVGMSTVQAIDSMNVDTVFLATTGISLDSHLSNSTYFEAEIKRSVIKRNRKIILLADNSKFDHRAVFSFCQLNQLYAVITDKMPPQPYVERFTQDNVQLLIAN